MSNNNPESFTDNKLVSIYDLFCGWDFRSDLEFYMPMAMHVSSVLDLGCGTGLFLSEARRRGHKGRLCGVDPSKEMLAIARRDSSVDWVEGYLTDVDIDGKFDLVVLTGHTFQLMLDDETTLQTFRKVHSLLNDKGKFVFESRNPRDEHWDDYTPENVATMTDEFGQEFTMFRELKVPRNDDIVQLKMTWNSPQWNSPKVTDVTLRFPNLQKVESLLADSGFSVANEYGDFDGSSFESTSPEMVFIASPKKQ